ncbi:MAG: IS5 family transposase [Pseudomonadota bacterium]
MVVIESAIGSSDNDNPSDYGFRRELASVGRVELNGAGFQHLVPRQKTLNVSLHYRGGRGPLGLLTDPTGIKSDGDGEWNVRKHGGPKRRIWRKIHIGIDEETLEEQAVESSTNSVGDAPMVPELLEQIPPDQAIGSVTADGAYDTQKLNDATAARGPMQSSHRAGAVARNWAVNAPRYLGRAIWRRWSGYHRLSRVESKMNCVKLLGQPLMAKDFDRQLAEIQVRVAVLNR